MKALRQAFSRWRRARSYGAPAHDDGAVLILALVFIVAIALILSSLLSLTGNDILNASNLQSQRAVAYAADGATTAAIQAVRYSDTPFTTPQSCLPNGAPSISLDGLVMSVTCDGKSQNGRDTPGCYKDVSNSNLPCTTRVVNFVACSGVSICSAASSSWLLQATVAFDDYKPNPPADPVDVCALSNGTETCGIGMAVVSWLVGGADS